MKTYNKKAMRTILITFYVMIIFFLSACQPNPEKEIVVNKGGGKLEGIIASAPAIAEQAIEADKWVETYTIPKLECKIDPEVVLPERKIFPVYKVKQRSFDESDSGRIVKFFTAGATGVRETSPTKEDLEQQLVQAKRGTYVSDEKGGERWEPYEGQEEEIKRIEEKLKNVQPEVFEPITEDTSIFNIDNTYAMGDGSRVYITANTTRIRMARDKNGIFQLESWVEEGAAIPGEPRGTTIEGVKISEDEARETVNKLIKDLGIQYMGIAEIEKARIVNEYTGEITSKGWQATLTRNDGGSVPVNIGAYQANITIDLSEEYTARWRPETITVYIDENGIKDFYWNNPLEIVEIMNENVPLMAFDDMKERIKGYIKYGFSRSVDAGWITSDIGLSVNKIVLTNILVPIKDEYREQMMLPAWVVFYVDINHVDGRVYISPTYIFAVNAIDGSNIDLEPRPPENTK